MLLASNIFTNFQHTKLYFFQNLSLGFILKTFLIFRKFQPRYSHKIYYKVSVITKFKIACEKFCDACDESLTV